MGRQKDNPNFKYARLTGHHFEKKKQLYDAQSLQYAVKNDLEIKEIHAAYSFKQIPFLRDFIISQVKKRSLSKNSMESTMYKLICNSIYCTFLCNVLNY